MVNNLTFKRYIPKLNQREIFTIILLITEIIVFAIISPNFISRNNLETVLRNSTDLAVVAIGMTIVMILGGIDISVGSSMGVVAIFVGWMLEASVSPFIIALVAMLTGTMIGFINGILVTKAKIPAIIATLGTSSILRALVFGLLGGMRGWLTGLPRVFGFLTRGRFLGLPVPIFLLAFIYLVFWYLLTYTRIGRHIYAVGNSEEASILSGISTDRIVLLSFSILGALVGITALIYIGRLASVEITVGQDLPMAAIAATVIGGTSVKGGKGSVVGTLAGVLFIAIMRNGVVLLGIPSLWERAVVGILIVISVVVDLYITKRIEKRKREELSSFRKGMA
jgi:ribose transport system permease protein/AI-2 transport system permease protein